MGAGYPAYTCYQDLVERENNSSWGQAYFFTDWKNMSYEDRRSFYHYLRDEFSKGVPPLYGLFVGISFTFLILATIGFFAKISIQYSPQSLAVASMWCMGICLFTRFVILKLLGSKTHIRREQYFDDRTRV